MSVMWTCHFAVQTGLTFKVVEAAIEESTTDGVLFRSSLVEKICHFSNKDYVKQEAPPNLFSGTCVGFTTSSTLFHSCISNSVSQISRNTALPVV